MLNSLTVIEFLSLSTHTSESSRVIEFPGLLTSALKFMDRAMTSLLTITFINSR